MNQELEHGRLVRPRRQRTGAGNRHVRRCDHRRGRSPSLRRRRDPQRDRRRRARRRGRHRLLRCRRASSRRLRGVGTRDGARRDRRSDRTDPPRIRCDRPQFGRSDPGVPTVRDTRRGLERSGRSDSRARIVHRVVSPVRIRAERLRASVRGEARSVRRAPRRAAGHVDRDDPTRPHRAIGVSANRIRTTHDVGGRRREPRVGRPRRSPSAALDAGDHRGRTGPVRTVRRPLSPCPRRVRRLRPSGRRAFTRARGGDRRGGPRAAVATLAADAQPHRARTRLGTDVASRVRPCRRPDWRVVRRCARNRRPQDRHDREHARCVSIRHEVQRRPAPPRAC